jgi:NADPH-dependent glutamate synthase beta subunit-like oxidoreductase
MIPSEDGGRPRPKLIEGVRDHLTVDRIVVAIGQGPDLEWMGEDAARVVGDERGWISVDDSGETKLEGVYSGGDLVNPVADAISAIADGLKAVEGITRRAVEERAGRG